MRQEAMSPRDRYRRRRTQKRWHKVMTVLCALVVFCTTYALILPAITMEKGCPIPEHTHDDGCYTQVTSREETILACTAQVHSHEASCQNAAGELVCGYADFLVHVHEDGCYDETGNLVCTLPEIRPHTHTEDCYALPQTHTHDESCYTPSRGALLCTLHAHGEDCWTESQRLICTQEETPGHRHSQDCYPMPEEPICGEAQQDGHTHSDSCFARSPEPACGREESQGHTHTESCWQAERVLTCGVESDHVHTDDCYAWEQALTCQREENADAQPELVCSKKEIIQHRHTPECRDANGSLICGQRQILQHQHGEECFQTRQIPVDTETLTCTDENHVHTPRCYGQWELTCGMEEHTHGPDCTPPEATEETKATEETETTEETEAADETAPEGVPSGLPVMGTAYAAQGPRRVMAAALTGADDPAEGETVTAKPVDVSTFIVGNGTKLEYKVDGSDWTNVEGVPNIPGNAEFKLTVKYENVPIQNLLAAGGQMTYTLPNIFRDAKADGSIQDDASHQVIGTITVTGQTATITFQEQWLRKQAETNSVIDGDFYVQGKANLSKIPDGGNQEIQIGDVTINVNFAGDLIAQYGDVQIEKTVATVVTQEDGKDYLEYTLTVTAGPDGCPKVTVTDTFGAGQEWVKAYVLLDGNTETVVINNENKTMTWTIGDMKAGDVKKLTYRILLEDGYTGGRPKDNIQNTAKVTSKTYDRNSATATFTPKSNATLSKGCLTDIKTLDGGKLELTYYVCVKARDTNYPLRDVVLKDSLDRSVLQDNYYTKPELRKYIYYDKNSFKLYEGEDVSANLSHLTTEYTTEPAGHLKFNDETNDNGEPNGAFEYHVGTLMPRESRTLVYTVVIEPGFFTVAGNKMETITNRASIWWVDEQGNTEFMPEQKVWCKKDIARKAWSRKVVGQAQTEDVTVDMTGGRVYNFDGTTTDNTPSFTAPVGSYQYQVLVNEAGDWDLSSAQLTDTLSSYMTFVGYVKVDAFHIDGNAPASSLENQTALDYFVGKTPDETFWVKVDNLTSFSIHPKVCTDRKNHAYRLTYYAQPNATGTVLVTNDFVLSGTVGYGGKTYTLAGIKASAQVTVSGDNSFGARKHALFYEPPKGTGDYEKGTLYWAIQVDGNSLPKGFALKDTPLSGNGNKGHHIHSDSLIGVYTGAADLELSNYKTLADLQSQLEEVQSGNYTSNREDGLPLTVRFPEGITLENESLYVLVKTEPDALPQNPRDVFTYKNGLETSSAEGNWVNHGPAQQTLYGKATIFKELADVFTTDGQDIKYINGTNRASYDAALLPGPGKYVGWLIHLNYAGTLDGTYRVEEQIPQGMEIAYIRMYWYGDKVKNTTPKSEMAEISGLGAQWSPKNNTSTGSNTGSLTNYYYVNGQTAIMDVTNLVPRGGYRDDYAVELQIVCKLTDKAVLLEGKTKDFNNKVTLKNPNGDVIDTAASPVTLSVPQMQKGKGDTAQVSGGNYPFTIQLNQEGIDLMPRADTITLVDELGENLTIDTASIKVKNSNTDKPLQEGSWHSFVETAADGKQTLKIILPDDQPLTISYTTTVNAPPGQTVTVQNKAHWEGYTTTTGGSVKDESFQYEAGGTAGGTMTPQIIISKVDYYNNQQKLAGATFKLTKMELQGGELVETGTPYTGTTDDNGKLTFGEGANLLDFDKVYRIQETQAPTGYVLDEKPHDVLFANKQDDNSYPDYSALIAKGVNIRYASTYTYTAPNRKGEIEVNKVFRNADGSPMGNRNGTYRFGLFAEPNGQMLQETSAVFEFGNQTEFAKFTNVDLGTPYYVYELDDQGKPIRNGAATVSGIPFVVSYEGNPITVTAKNPSGTVTVTNRINYAELPQTGGGGISAFRTLGTALVFCAAGAMLVRWCRMAQYITNGKKSQTRGRRRGRYEK